MILLVSTLGVGIGSVAAQDDDIPSLPAAYHGELTVSDGSLDTPVRLTSVGDGEIEDEIIVDTDGSIGGPTISDDKLEAQEPENGTVEFRIGSEPVTIESLNGDPINDDSIGWESGDQEITLQIGSVADIPTEIDLSIAADDTVEADEPLGVTATIENTGPIEATPEVALQSSNGTVVDSTDVTVPIDEATETTLSWTLTPDDVGNQTVTVVAGNETASTDVEVETPDIADPDPGGVGDGGGQGGQGGVPPSGPSDDDTTTPGDTNQSGEAYETIETQFIVTSDRFGISQVRFTEATTLASITWQTPTIPEESVTVETYDDAPTGVPAVPGSVLSVSDVSLPANVSAEPATVEFRADKADIDTAGSTPDELTIARLTDGNWEALGATVTEETNQTVLVEAETPGFSNFAVTTNNPTAVIDAPNTTSSGSEVTVAGTNSTTPFGDIVSYEWTIDGESRTGERVAITTDDPGETTIELTVENDAGATETTTTTLTTTENSIPGFGMLAALSALLAATVLLYRRH